MCGITGGWWAVAADATLNRIRNSLGTLRKRGPDDQGYEQFSLNRGDVILGHTRLSIIDLSSAGHQPMNSKNGRFSIVFNGEIYNYRELRQELLALGHVFISDSDTEVLLASWEEWHISCLQRLEGMFAFVIYDQEKKTLTSVRDAFGIKPFFYDHSADHFLFSSEQKALLELRTESPQLNWQRCYDYLTHADYDSESDTFIKGINHLMPGHYIEINLLTSQRVKQQSWWTPNIHKTSNLTFPQAAELVRDQFLHNIRLHLRSDVPLGSALSGGVDSSAVVCAIRHIEPDIPIHTFSYIAPQKEISEEKWVDCVNQYVGAIPHKVTATSEDLKRDLGSMIASQGEPFGSTSIYAQYRVFQLAKENDVTVTLDGQGADELLAGYIGYPGQRMLSMIEEGRYLNAHQFAMQWGRWPGRSYKKALMYFGSVVFPDKLYYYARKKLGRSSSPLWLNAQMMEDAGVKLSPDRMERVDGAKGRRVAEYLAHSLTTQGLPALLRHGDRNSMNFSVESRVPFLTLPLAELLLSLPEDYLISDQGETKCVFREAMRGIVPNEILDRKDKIGFATPEKEWLLGMADTVRNWLQASDQISFINRDALIRSFDSVVCGKTEFSWQVWRWINFVKWHETLGIK